MTDQTTSSGPARVLVVEDQGLIALRLEHMLTRLGYQVTEAVSNGEAALQSLERFPPDLVLMDINLEDEMDGVETAARIRARRDVPVVYLTAYSEQMVMDEVKHTHPYGFLAKPVRDQELGATIEMALYKHHMEVQLRESEAKYRLLAENAEDMIWQLNETLDRYTYVSPSITRLLGYTPQEMMSIPLGAHLAPDSRPQIQAMTDRLLAAEKEGRGADNVQVVQVQYIRKDGTKVWVESRTRPVRDQAGVFRGLIGVTRDIGDRVQSEKKLRESEQRVRRKLDTILLPGGDLGALELADILDVDAFQAMMDHFYDLTGIGMAVVDLAGEVLVATGWQEICTQFHRVHPETRQHCIESDTLLSSGVEPGQLKLYKCKNNMWDMATPIVIGDQHVGNIFLGQFFFEGEEIDRELFREQAERYGFDPEQYLAALDRAPRWSRETVETVFAFYARLATMVSNLSHSNLRLARALSEQDRLLAARRQSEQKFRTLVENVVDWVWQVDTNGVYIYVSPQATQILGYPVSAILGKTPFDFMTSQEVKRVGAIFSELVAKQERILGLEDTMIAQDGHPVFFETNATPLFDAQGTFIGYMGTCRDITARKEAREALQQTSERLRILHEIDTAILRAHSPDEIALAALAHLRDLLSCRHISLSEIDLARQQSRETIVLVDDQLRARAADWRPISRIGPRLIETLSRGDIYLVGDLGAQKTLSALEQRLLAAGLCSYVSVPMLVQNELVGAINMASPRPDFFQPAHVEILNEIAASLAVAMQQANLLAQTQEDAESKTLLLQEVNHRVMNNLHMIQSILELEMEQSPPRTDRDLDTVLRDIRSRVQGIATVHRMLSSAQRDALDLAQLTSAIVDAASSGAPIPYQVAVAIDAPPDVPHVSAKQAVTLALVLNELTTNSVKYAFADRMGGEIRVCIERTAAETGAGVRLVFQDDGPGWPDDVLAGERHSMGLWLIQASVTHNLGGEIAWYNEDGAVVEIRFPIRG